MKKNMMISFAVVILMAGMAFGQSVPEAEQTVSGGQKDPLVNQNMKPDESGYADIKEKWAIYTDCQSPVRLFCRVQPISA